MSTPERALNPREEAKKKISDLLNSMMDDATQKAADFVTREDIQSKIRDIIVGVATEHNERYFVEPLGYPEKRKEVEPEVWSTPEKSAAYLRGKMDAFPKASFRFYVERNDGTEVQLAVAAHNEIYWSEFVLKNFSNTSSYFLNLTTADLKEALFESLAKNKFGRFRVGG